MVPPTESTQNQILGAAVRCFSKDGLAKTRISDIAKEAGVGKGTVYEYYESKEELLISCAEFICNGFKEPMEQSMRELAQLSADKALPQFIAASVATFPAFAQEHMRVYMDLWNLSKAQPKMLEKVRALVTQNISYFESQIISLYQRGVDEGIFREIPYPQIFGHTMTAMVDGWAWQTFFRPELNFEKIGKELADNMLALLLIK